MDVAATATQLAQLQVLQTSQKLNLAAIRSAATQEQSAVQLVTGIQAAPPPAVGSLVDVTA